MEERLTREFEKCVEVGLGQDGFGDGEGDLFGGDSRRLDMFVDVMDEIRKDNKDMELVLISAVALMLEMDAKRIMVACESKVTELIGLLRGKIVDAPMATMLVVAVLWRFSVSREGHVLFGKDKARRMYLEAYTVVKQFDGTLSESQAEWKPQVQAAIRILEEADQKRSSSLWERLKELRWGNSLFFFAFLLVSIVLLVGGLSMLLYSSYQKEQQDGQATKLLKFSPLVLLLFYIYGSVHNVSLQVHRRTNQLIITLVRNVIISVLDE